MDRADRLKQAGDKIVDILEKVKPTGWVVSGVPTAAEGRVLCRYVQDQCKKRNLRGYSPVYDLTTSSITILQGVVA